MYLSSPVLCGYEITRNAGVARAGAFAIHGKATRKRTYVFSNPVPRVFVVDDEPVIASTLAAILQMNGFSAKFFTCPLEALTAARLKAPDLLISDVAMPGISGVDLAVQMRAQYPTCKILLFSGQTATLDLLEGARAQGHDFALLLKPVHPTELLFEVGKVINGTVAIYAVQPAKPTMAGREARGMSEHT
jgi:DNA-binding response OmpR family regulator